MKAQSRSRTIPYWSWSLLVLAMAWNFSLPVKAEVLEVQSLEFGGCWTAKEEGTIKVSDFNNGKSYRWGKQDFADVFAQLGSFLSENHLDESDLGPYQVYLHCRSDGLGLFIHFHESNPQLCLHVSPKDGRLNLDRVLPQHDGAKGFCEGQNPGVLMVNVGNTGEENLQCRKALRERYGSYLEDVKELKNFVTLKLRPEFYFKENEVKDLLLQERECQNVLSKTKIEYDSLRIPPGSDFELFDGAYSNQR